MVYKIIKAATTLLEVLIDAYKETPWETLWAILSVCVFIFAVGAIPVVPSVVLFALGMMP